MKVRVTGILINNGSLLLLEQNVDNERAWSLPGGGVEKGESIEAALVREMEEETGLQVTVGDLLYVCDHIKPERHVVHLTFLIYTNDKKITGTTPGLDDNEIKSIKFVPVSKLESFGFSKKFTDLAKNGFPGKGSYMGSKKNIGL
ncbi:NUDIX hydrolase [Candidatus Saccharibacteria bacterium]|nr:NUDIX hydrolase [Candidatus Saccharibacteria bacterium]